MSPIFLTCSALAARGFANNPKGTCLYELIAKLVIDSAPPHRPDPHLRDEILREAVHLSAAHRDAGDPRQGRRFEEEEFMAGSFTGGNAVMVTSVKVGSRQQTFVHYAVSGVTELRPRRFHCDQRLPVHSCVLLTRGTSRKLFPSVSYNVKPL